MAPSPERRPRRSLAPVLGVGIVSLLGMLGTFKHGLGVLDEGFMLSAAERVAHGQLPYRDFFTLITPGAFWVNGLAFRLFGISILVERGLAVVLGTAIPVLIAAIALEIAGPAFAVVAGLLGFLWGVSYPWYPIYANYSWYATAFALAACLLLVRDAAAASGTPGVGIAAAAERGPDRSVLFGVGVCVGLTGVFKQNAGVCAAIAVLAFLALTQWRRPARMLIDLAIVAGSALLPVVPAILAIALGGGMQAMIRDLVVLPITSFRTAAAIPYPPLWPPPFADVHDALRGFLQLGMWWVTWIPFVYPALATAAIVAALRGAPRPRAELAALVFASTMFLTVFPRADLVHVLLGLPAGFPVLALALSRTWGGRPLRDAHATTVILRLAVLGFLFVMITAPALQMYMASRHLVPLDTPRGRVLVARQVREQAASVLSEIERRSRPGEGILVVPWAASYYFLSGRVNPTRYDLFVVGNIDPSGEAEMIHDLEATRPHLLVWGHEYEVDGRSIDDCAPEVARYLRRHYRPQVTRGRYEFLERESESPAPTTSTAP